MSENNEVESLSARSRPQYHYFYGSTDSAADSITEGQEQEQDSLLGEALLSTDHEEDAPTPKNSENDFQHLLITNGDSTKPWFLGSRTQERANSHGLGRVLFLILLAAGMSSFFAFLLLPHTSAKVPAAQIFRMPFEEVSRADYGDPVEGFINLDLFHPTLLSSSEPRSFVFPFVRCVM